MHDQCSPAEADQQIDSAVLALLLAEDDQPVWAVEEVAREMDNSFATEDALRRLHGAGLVHRIDPFVFATRTARQAAQLAL